MHLLSGLLSIGLLGLASAASTSGCGKASAPIPLSTRHNETVPSLNRTFMYWLPPSYVPGKPSPAIMSFHGALRTSDWQANLDRLTSPFFNTDHILIYPQSLKWNGSYAWEGAPDVPYDDVGYSMAVLDQLEDKLCIDTERVYATGKSQGAGFVGILACDAKASERFAAFAPVSGAFYVNTSDCSSPQTLTVPCHTKRCNTPILDFHGGNDQTINITGGEHNGGCLPAVHHWVDLFAERDGLAVPAGGVNVTNATTGTTVYTYGSGDKEGLVTFVYDGTLVDHDWPATINNTDNVSHNSGPASFNASSMIMEFFKKYTLPKDIDGCPASGGYSTSVWSGYMNYTTTPTPTTAPTTSVQTMTSTNVVVVSGTTSVVTTSATTSATGSVQTNRAERAYGVDRGSLAGNVISGLLALLMAL